MWADIVDGGTERRGGPSVSEICVKLKKLIQLTGHVMAGGNPYAGQVGQR